MNIPDQSFDSSHIEGYHAHIYYGDQNQRQVAEGIRDAIETRFDVVLGRWRDKPVGPHPDWSCQLTIPTAMMGEVMGWLALNRKALVLFIHPLTGNALQEHRDAAIWMGKVRPLKLDQFL